MSGDSEGAPRLSCRVCFIQQNESLRLPSDPLNLILNQVTTSLRERESTAAPRTPKSTELPPHVYQSPPGLSEPHPWAHRGPRPHDGSYTLADCA